MAAKPSGKNSYSKPKTKKPASSKPKGKRDTGGFDWGDGHKVHSIPLAQHQANRAGVGQYGLLPNTPLDQPLTAGQAYQMALAQAGQQYDPQIGQVKTLQASVPGWYKDYLARATAAQTAANTYAQPLLDTAKTGITNAATLTPGLDPNSPQAQADAQAAAGRSSLAQLGYDTLAVVPAATTAYFGGQQATAARELPQVLAGYGQQMGQLQGQKAQAAASAYGQIRTGEQNASIARETLGLNTQKALDDVAASDADRTQSAADKKAARTVSRKNTRDRIAAQKDAKQTAADKKAAADAQKKTASIQKATGAIKSKIADARDAWERYARTRNPATKFDPTTSQNIPDIDPKTGKQKTIKATPDQIKAQLRKDGYTEAEIHVMLMLRAGKQLTPSDIQRLRDQDPNFRVPSEWRQKKSRTAAQDKDPHGTAKAPDRAPGNARGHI